MDGGAEPGRAGSTPSPALPSRGAVRTPLACGSIRNISGPPPWSHLLRFSWRVLRARLRWAEHPWFWAAGSLLWGFPPACAGRAGSSPAHRPHICLTMKSPHPFWGLGWLGWHRQHHLAGETEAWGGTGLAAGDGVAHASRAWGRAAPCWGIPMLGIAFPWLLHRVDAMGMLEAGDAGGSPWVGLARMGLLGCALSPRPQQAVSSCPHPGS